MRKSEGQKIPEKEIVKQKLTELFERGRLLVRRARRCNREDLEQFLFASILNRNRKSKLMLSVAALLSKGVPLPFIEAEEAFQSLAPKIGRPNDKEVSAKAFLIEMLKEGEMLSSDCEEKLEAAGFKKSTIKKAKE